MVNHLSQNTTTYSTSVDEIRQHKKTKEAIR